MLNTDPGILVLVDGCFHQCLAVGHAELRCALQRGWAVWGLGSLGAIRAFEMRHIGMRGFGRVYGHFLANGDFQDDEVALLHSPDPPYAPASEPLVHLRYCVADLERAHEIDSAGAWRVINELKGMWYGDRSLETLAALVEHHGGARAAKSVRDRITNFDRFRVKTHDLAEFFARSAWLNEHHQPVAAPAPYTVGSSEAAANAER